MGDHIEVQSEKMGQTGIKSKITESKHMFISDYDGSHNLFLTFAISDTQRGLPKVTCFSHPCSIFTSFLENVLVDYLNQNHMTLQEPGLVLPLKNY